MKVYKLTKPKDYKGLFAESLVEDPAIQSNLMAFDSEKDDFIFSDEEQRIIYAPALIPNKLIFRKDIKGEPAYVYFDAETIKELVIDQARNPIKPIININHSKDAIEGVHIFESWLVLEKEVDKSFKMGFDVSNGTLMRGYKVDNDAIWQDIKLGNLKGLSIEGQLLPIEEVVTQLKKENMNKKGLISLAFEAFKSAFKFADMVDYGNGNFGSSLEIGSIVTDADGNPKPNSDFEFEGKKYKTDDMGAISEVEEIQVAVDEPAVDSELEDAKSKILELETKIADLEAQIATDGDVKMSAETKATEMESKIVELEAEIIEAKKIQNIPVVELKYEEMTNAQKVKHNRGK